MDIDNLYDIVVDSMPQIFIKNSDEELIFNSFNVSNNEYNLDTMKYIGGFNELKSAISVYFDFDRLIEATKVLTNNLNRVIDLNYYPVPETDISNNKHRPLGLGVQGLADVFIKMNWQLYKTNPAIQQIIPSTVSSRF